jgi:Ner family transcriptional regulator
MPRKARGWHREDIKAAIRKHGITLEELSVANGLDPRACSLALLRPHFAAELVIAEFLGRSPRELWPQRFDDDGTYRHPKSQDHHTRRGWGRNVEEERAA